MSVVALKPYSFPAKDVRELLLGSQRRALDDGHDQ